MKRTISIVMAVILLAQMPACTTRKVRIVNDPKIINPTNEKIIGITTKTGDQINFDPLGAVVQDGKLKAKVNNKDYEIAIGAD